MNIEEIDNEIASKTNLIYALANIQEGYTVDIINLMQQRDFISSSNISIKSKFIYKFDIKRTVNTLLRTTILFRENLNVHYKDNLKFKEVFGESTDLLEEEFKRVIEDKVKWKTEK